MLEYVHIQTPSPQGFHSTRKQCTALPEAQLPGATASLQGGGEGEGRVGMHTHTQCVYTCASGRRKCTPDWRVSTREVRGTCCTQALDWGGGRVTGAAGLASFTQMCSRHTLRPAAGGTGRAPGSSYSWVCRPTIREALGVGTARTYILLKMQMPQRAEHSRFR